LEFVICGRLESPLESTAAQGRISAEIKSFELESALKTLTHLRVNFSLKQLSSAV